MNWSLKIIEKHDEIAPVEDLQRRIWSGSEIDIIPAHLLQAAVHNGGLLITATTNIVDPSNQEQPENKELIGFVFGFPGFYTTPDGPRVKHCSHMLGVDPRYRNQGLGFALKRAQWQMVRHQGIDRITWTYDPLLSPNAHLNIARLGAVCGTYLSNYYGAMRDQLNIGLPSDRLQVDWWVNSRRVNFRLSRRPRSLIQLDHMVSAEVKIINEASLDQDGWPHPFKVELSPKAQPDPLILVEIPADFQSLKRAQPELALEWRMHTRGLFVNLFRQGYLITDFIHESSTPARSYYVLSFGESTF